MRRRREPAGGVPQKRKSLVTKAKRREERKNRGHNHRSQVEGEDGLQDKKKKIVGNWVGSKRRADFIKRTMHAKKGQRRGKKGHV